MKSIHIILVLMVINVSTVFGQSSDTKVTTAIVRFQSGDYQEAYDALNVALENTTSLKEKNVAKAYYYRAKARLRLMTQLAQARDYDGLEALGEYAALDSYDDLKKAIETDIDLGKYKKMATTELEALLNPLLQGGLGALNAQQYETALKYLNPVIEMKPDYYVAYDLRAQAKYELAGGLNATNQADAKADFLKMAELYKTRLPESPDLLIGYGFYRLALITRYIEKDVEAALSHIQEGQQLLDSEYARCSSKKENYDASQWAKVEQQYSDAKRDLSAFELDIYLNFPEKKQEAIERFKQAIEANPQDYIIHVAYAQLLETEDPTLAASVYKDAIQIDPDKQIAHFNLGALYVNEGVEWYKKSNEEDDYGAATKYERMGAQEFRKALPYLEKAHEIKPDDLGTINALLQVTITLEENDKYTLYKSKKAELEGY